MGSISPCWPLLKHSSCHLVLDYDSGWLFFFFLVPHLNHSDSIDATSHSSACVFLEDTRHFWLLSWVRICLPMQKTQVRSLGREDPLEKEMATHSSLLVWKIPWTEKPGRLQSMVLQSQTWLRDCARMQENYWNVMEHCLTIRPWIKTWDMP